MSTIYENDGSTTPVSTIHGKTVTTRTPLQGQLVVLKVMLEDAKAKLSEREWHTLRACLLIYLQADAEREGG